MIIIYIIFFNLIAFLSSVFINYNRPLNLTLSQKESKLKENKFNQIARDLQEIDNICTIIDAILKQENITEFIINIKPAIPIVFSKYIDDEYLKIIPEIVNDFINKSNINFINLMDALEESKDSLRQSIEALPGESKNISNYIKILLNNTSISNCVKDSLKQYPDLSNLIYALPSFFPNIKDLEKNDIDLIYNFTKKHYNLLIDLCFVIIRKSLNEEEITRKRKRKQKSKS